MPWWGWCLLVLAAAGAGVLAWWLGRRSGRAARVAVVRAQDEQERAQRAAAKLSRDIDQMEQDEAVAEEEHAAARARATAAARVARGPIDVEDLSDAELAARLRDLDL